MTPISRWSAFETSFQAPVHDSWLASEHTQPINSTILTSAVFQTVYGCGHGGTRYSNTALRLQTWSVNPAAIAGVHGRHTLTEPLPLVASGTRNGWRKLAWGRTKL